LIITNAEDSTADLVADVLRRRNVQVHRFDVADFPLRLEMNATLDYDGWSGDFIGPSGPIDLSTVQSIYYRRPTRFQFPNALSGDSHTFAELEARAGMLGVLASLRCTWINSPDKEMAASYKPIQLAKAVRYGLKPPATVVTNNPSTARAFVARCDKHAIYKPIGKDLADEPASTPVSATRLVGVGEIDESIEWTAHLFQEYVPKAYEVRLTIVGRRMFAVEIHAGSEAARLDWRTDYDSLTYKVTTVPNVLRSPILSLMDDFGLVFGAMDFVVTPEGEWRFLEVNPNGQWLWLSRETGLPIAEGIANELAGNQHLSK